MKKVLLFAVILAGVTALGFAGGMSEWATANAAYNRGVTYHDNGDYNRAITEFTVAINKNPQTQNSLFINSYFGRANAYYQIGDYGNAIADYEVLLQNNYVNTNRTIADTARSNLALAKQQQPPAQQGSGQAAQSQQSGGQAILTQADGEQTVQQNGGQTAQSQQSSGQAILTQATPTQTQTIVTVEQGNNLAEKFDWLKVFAQSNTSYIIEVRADESITSQSLSYSGKSDITIILRGVGANRTLRNIFYVGSSVTLVLDNNITIRGGSVRVEAGGIFIMNNGSTITGNDNFCGVSVGERGTFIMNGGTISGNNNYPWGGGVSVGERGTFTMNGGTISGNTTHNGGGVYVRGTFIMNNGTITGNTVLDYSNGDGDGGGVYVRIGTFTMIGGTISNNLASNGGGVSLEGGTFTLNNGTISDNTARKNGGGVSLKGATFTLNNGTISGNTASENGGGVSLERGTFTLNNGTISGNTAHENGGGVFVVYGGYSSVAFTKTGGTIYGYNASDQRNSNVVKNESGVVQNFRGHAVWAGSSSTLLKIREGTAGPGDNMSYNGNTRPPTASGVWDN